MKAARQAPVWCVAALAILLACELVLAGGCGTPHDRSEREPGNIESGDEISQGRVSRLDHAVDAIVPQGARIEKVAGGFQFIEGPIWIPEGALLFSDIRANAIYRFGPGQGVTEFRKPSGYYDNADPPATAMLGSNGLTLDRQGRLLICEHGNRRITRIEPDGRLTVVADRHQGKRLNYPNDVVVKSDGTIYFTDPPSGGPGPDNDPRKEQSVNGVYRVKDGEVELLSDELQRPNGLAFSPDETYLYVSNTAPDRRIWMRFEVKKDGTLGGGRVFHDVTADTEPGVPDGLKVDTSGNVYATGPGGVRIFSPEGKVLGRIEPPEVPYNVGWGDDGRTLYMTARTSLYRIRLAAMGVRP